MCIKGSFGKEGCPKDGVVGIFVCYAVIYRLFTLLVYITSYMGLDKI